MRHDRRFLEKYGPWAVVAGASEGLGAEFARQLAELGFALVLVARRPATLEAEAERLRRQYHVEVLTVAGDLGAHETLETVVREGERLDVGLIVYNAALSPIGPFLEQPLDSLERTLDVNCRAPMTLVHGLGRRMAARGRGGIILMASMAGLQGSPLIAAYAASKAYNLRLAEGLWEELAGRGVDVLACAAGATRTPNYEASQPARPRWYAPSMEPEVVVRQALAALGYGPVMTPGLGNRLAGILLERCLPRSWAVRLMGATTRSMYERSMR